MCCSIHARQKVAGGYFNLLERQKQVRIVAGLQSDMKLESSNSRLQDFANSEYDVIIGLAFDN